MFLSAIGDARRITPFPSLTIVLLDRLFGPRVQRHKGALIVTRSAGGRRECPYGPRQPPGPRPVRSQNRPAAMQRERMRMRAELTEVIVAAQRTVARSRALLVEVEAVLAREKLPLVTPQVSPLDAAY